MDFSARAATKDAARSRRRRSCTPPRASSTLPALSSGGLENERTTPRATFRRGQLSLQSNEIFGRTNPIPERSRRRANCAQAFVAGPAVFPLYFQRAGWPILR